MKTLLFIFFFTLQSTFAFSVGNNAPDFKLMGHSGKEYSLSEFAGKWVVLEWFNHGCPFVRKHYDSQNMQRLQKKYKDKVVWLAINSSATNKQGYLKDATFAKGKYQSEGMAAKALLIDTSGTVGRVYGAKTTPHMYIINPKGKLAYMGAIDSVASADSGDIKGSTNYIDQALSEALSGKAISVSRTKPYGCSVKY